MEIFTSIPVFVAVVECGSFSAAAVSLGVTKSAVSKRINQLENQLGIKLIHRTTRSLSLTEAGEHYFDYARNALTIASEGEDAITRLQKSPQGTLRINAPMGFGRLHLAPLVPQFLLNHPQIQIDMEMDDKVVDMVSGSFDIAIRIGELPDSSLIAKHIAPCVSVMCASPSYLAKHGIPSHPTELATHNCLNYSYFQAGNEWRYVGPEGPVSVVPKGNYIVNNSEALYEGLIAGLGIGQMPTFIVGHALKQGKLIALLPEYHLPKHAIYAMLTERKHVPAKTRLFIEFLQQHFDKQTPHWDK
ncbi:MAG: LysR family transcriptional regulator [Aliivibrio sp.]|uniref:LysR family transcriptional regulator n=1 Tax=Aliivibrio sp. TaxID=1872443 RepID=UPI001A51EB3D|nr:LysR family transcriptional regulator [Aliivibrio sp.]